MGAPAVGILLINPTKTHVLAALSHSTVTYMPPPLPFPFPLAIGTDICQISRVARFRP